MIADIFPLERAVKTAEVKMFIPQHKKLNEKIKNPFLAISQTGVPLEEKIFTKYEPRNIDIANIKAETVTTKSKQILNTFFKR